MNNNFLLAVIATLGLGQALFAGPTADRFRAAGSLAGAKATLAREQRRGSVVEAVASAVPRDLSYIGTRAAVGNVLQQRANAEQQAHSRADTARRKLFEQRATPADESLPTPVMTRQSSLSRLTDSDSSRVSGGTRISVASQSSRPALQRSQTVELVREVARAQTELDDHLRRQEEGRRLLVESGERDRNGMYLEGNDFYGDNLAGRLANAKNALGDHLAAKTRVDELSPR